MKEKAIIFLVLLAVFLLCGIGYVSCNNKKSLVQTEKANASYQSGELVSMVKAFYESQYGIFVPEADFTENKDNTYTIRLYEKAEREEVCCCYTVDASGKGVDELTGKEITVPAISLADTAAYIGIPVKLHYIENGEIRNEWEITDIKTLTSCMEALQQVQIGNETDVRAMDAGEVFSFEFENGTTWTLSFEAGDLVRNAVCYETTGFSALHWLIRGKEEQ